VKTVFLGSGPFGLPALERLSSEQELVELVRVISRPDRPAGRGRKLVATPVRVRAEELGLPCDTPDTVNETRYLEELEALQAELFVVVDYGEMLHKRLRELPTIGIFNLHPSLLPRYRGAAPVPRALLAGEPETGVALFRVERKLDSGPIVDMEGVPVEPLETTGELEERLSHVAAELLGRNLERFRTRTFAQKPQDHQKATYAPKLEKGEGLIHWDREPWALSNFVRALNPWPTAWSMLHQEGRKPERTAFLRVRPGASQAVESLEPGTVLEVRKDGFQVSCKGGSVEVVELKREGKAALGASAYLRGRTLKRGDRFRGVESGF
jgi:methionyl-tRNA formyltransferase